ncbi:hypothetical protein H0A36_07790 [Endozoicomonas sp. SM1973]|uniref:Uncharacterized protein n=1 Tax=Spartinivicinus marinus TaxID=2994442 RepID=A0A853I738_9GAMM|nr:hypothetical protein [Spartinivicinus marinus]MCX4029177.1 hypothetical protein [Spartinivicinus marinus]NYZ65914.1 hypothetical protein [Spartinivicinus marinus]
MNHQSTPNKPLPLKDAVTQEVKKVNLKASELEHLIAMQTAAFDNTTPDQQPSQKKARYLTGISACFAFIMVSLLMVQTLFTTKDLSESIALEVVNYHIKQSPLDVKTESFTGIRQYFTKLDFVPQQSSLINKLTGPTSTMLGGRYCSIQGITAAQLRYQLNGDIITLYEVGYDAKHFGDIPNIDLGESPKTVMSKGLAVSMWVEMGLLMVSVTQP